MTNIQIKFFTIVNAYGQPYVTIKIDNKLNENLLSSFLSAVYALGKESLEDSNLNISIQSKDSRIESFSQKDLEGKIKYIAFALVSDDISHKEFIMFAEKVLDDFNEKYGANIDQWDGNLLNFQPFLYSVENMIIDTFQVTSEDYDSKLDVIFDKIASGDMTGLDEL